MAESPFLASRKTVRSPVEEVKVQNEATTERRALRPRQNSTTKTEDTTKATKPTKITKDTPRHEAGAKAANTTQQVIGQQTETTQGNQDITNQTNTPKMEQQKMQQIITSFIPEFNGDNRMNELDRFVGAADATYDTLNTEQDKQTFNRLIQFRLAGDAYNRIRNRNTKDYKTFITTLINMYGTTETLEDRENKFVNIQQAYGESIRNYGYRLAEELAKYKTAYLQKYQITNIDQTYEKHLDTTAITIFKRGLNNTIIKEKIATQKAETLDDIIHDTEVTEKMLLSTTTMPLQQIISTPLNSLNPQQSTQPNYRNPEVQPTNFKRPTILCNYCQKPGHTWDICRTRLNNERQSSANRQQPQFYNSNRYTQNRQSYPATNPRFTNHNQAQQQNQAPVMSAYQTQQQQNLNVTNQQQQLKNYTPANPQNGSSNYNRYNQQPNFLNYRQQTNRPDFTNRPAKYCSHCKTTVGHTFDECRNKFLPRRNTDDMNNYERQQQQVNKNLEEQFRSMQINSITHQKQEVNQDHNQQLEPNCNQNHQLNQGNEY